MNKMKEREKRLCEYVKSDGYVPLTIMELIMVLDVPKKDENVFYNMLSKLVSEQRLTLSRKGRVMPAAEPIVGILSAMASGNCILTYDGGELFIDADNLNGAYHKDKVSAVITEKALGTYRAEGRVVKILRRGIKIVPGIVRKKGKAWILIPDDKRLDFTVLIQKDAYNALYEGHKVVAEITSFDKTGPKGIISKILGTDGEPNAEVLSIVIQNDIPYEFGADVVSEAKGIPRAVCDADINGRLDLRDLLTITIDGEDTKDFDDAITIDFKDGIYTLGVHIADVAHYVREKSPIDKEALNRGNSVYLPGMVIPMLPFALSNGICSLQEGEDRLSISCIMTIDSEGGVISHDIKEAVININRRFTYNEVSDILENSSDFAEDNYIRMFRQMKALEEALSKKREQRGALDFYAPETKVTLDEKGVVTDIFPYDRNAASKIIEEFMILANETVAEQYFWRGYPFVYRTHDAPDNEKILALSDFLRNFGLYVKGGSKIHPKSLQKVLNDIEGTKEQNIVSKSILRTMKQARYQAENKGHFGLSLKYYCHFTSPIRRYADLQIHRIIKKSLSEPDFIPDEKLSERCEKVSARVSKTERTAETAERDVVKLKMCEYMQNKTGIIYEGVISYIAKYGIYVELLNTVSGIVYLSSMTDDYYIYDSTLMCYAGERTGKIYKLGAVVKVKVYYVSLKDRMIEFIFI